MKRAIILLAALLFAWPTEAEDRYRVTLQGLFSEHVAGQVDFAHKLKHEHLWGLASLGFGCHAESVWYGIRRHPEKSTDRFSLSQSVQFGVHNSDKSRAGIRGDLVLHATLDDVIADGVGAQIGFGLIKISGTPLSAGWSIGVSKSF